MLEILVVGVTIGVGLFLYLTWYHDIWRKAGVPGPKPNAFYGNTPSMFSQNRNTLYELDEIYREYKKTGAQFVGMFQLREPRLMIIDPERVKDVFIRKFNHFHDNEFGDWVDEKIDPILARNPYILTGEKWKNVRDEITPAFAPARIKVLSPMIKDICKTMIGYINKQIDLKVEALDTKEVSTKYTIDVLSKCIFGLQANSFDDAENKAVIREMANRLMAPSIKMIFYMLAAGLFPAIKKYIKIKYVPYDVEQFFTKLMENAERYRNGSNSSPIDYLDHLIQLRQQKNISNLDMAAHGVTFFMDGFEKTSTAQAGCLYLLARNPDIQTRLRNEIMQAVDSHDVISIEKVLELKYLEQVIAESLRLFPPTAVLTKLCTETVELNGIKDHKLKLGKGKVVVVPMYSIQRDPEYYPEPEKFDPERFSEVNGGTKMYENKGVYWPFGIGPRTCLGREFGLMLIKLGIVEIIRNFEITVDPKTQEPVVIDSREIGFFSHGILWLNYKKL